MKSFLSSLILVLATVASNNAAAVVIDFEDLATADGGWSYLPENYKGFNWSTTRTFQDDGSGTHLPGFYTGTAGDVSIYGEGFGISTTGPNDTIFISNLLVTSAISPQLRLTVSWEYFVSEEYCAAYRCEHVLEFLVTDTPTLLGIDIEATSGISFFVDVWGDPSPLPSVAMAIFDNIDIQYNTVPEPASIALFSLGLVGIGLAHRRKS